ncbi:MAG: glycosyltransferase, partial [Bdellovibrionaceae bacterium]|nr:glycosyltransferase [Pseudobdellovibrionaceae bacterium]
MNSIDNIFMTPQPLISVIMPIYNSEKTLDAAVRSVLRQTFANFELIMVEDGSSDRSWNLVQKFAAEDSRIRIYKNETNLGLMKTLNRAIEFSTTSLLARLDSDDEMLPTRLEKQKTFLDQHSEVAVLGTWYSFMGRTPADDLLFRLPVGDAIQQQLLIENPICHSSVMFRKEAFHAVGGYRSEFRNAEDYDLWLRFSKLHKLENIPESLIRVRLSLGGNSIAHRRQMQAFRELALKSYRYPEKNLNDLK